MLQKHHRGGSRIFFRRGCIRLLPYFKTNKPHSFFFFFRRILVVLENRRSSQGGVRTPCTLPLDPPLHHFWNNRATGAALLKITAIDRHLPSRTAFPSSYSWNEAKLSVSGAWWPLNRGVNKGRTLFGTAKSWPRPLNSGLRAHSFLQLFRAFDYWPLNRGWLLNRWPVDERLTELRTYQRQSSVKT